jgi:hypothetical protein
VAGAALGAQATLPAAASAGDDRPCTAPFHHATHGPVQYCPLWMPSKGYVPVHALASGKPVEIGRLDEAGSANWFICQLNYPGIRYTAPGTRYSNTWWALTVSDDGHKGWVSEVYFSGGANDEPDAGLRRCGSNTVEQRPNVGRYRSRSCDSRWMTGASAEGSGKGFVTSIWPTRRARWTTAGRWAAAYTSPKSPDLDAVWRSMAKDWRSMWSHLQRCLDFPSNRNFYLTGSQRRSMYKQLVCHALYAVHERIGGPSWDLEATQRDISWSKIYNPLAVRRHGCNWDK